MYNNIVSVSFKELSNNTKLDPPSSPSLEGGKRRFKKTIHVEFDLVLLERHSKIIAEIIFHFFIQRALFELYVFLNVLTLLLAVDYTTICNKNNVNSKSDF